MKKRRSDAKNQAKQSRSAGRFVLGRDQFAQIRAVEGVALSDEMRSIRERMDSQNLTPAERRHAIIVRHTPPR